MSRKLGNNRQTVQYIQYCTVHSTWYIVCAVQYLVHTEHVPLVPGITVRVWASLIRSQCQLRTAEYVLSGCAVSFFGYEISQSAQFLLGVWVCDLLHVGFGPTLKNSAELGQNYQRW
jgi:hypothetical protein